MVRRPGIRDNGSVAWRPIRAVRLNGRRFPGIARTAEKQLGRFISNLCFARAILGFVHVCSIVKPASSNKA
jgi:hypothetical protein